MATLQELEEERASMHAYLIMKLRQFDYHAVADAAMDLRELQVKIDILNNNPFDAGTCNADKFNETIK